MYNEIIESIEFKTKEVQSLIFELKQVKSNLGAKNLKTKEIVEMFVEAEMIADKIVTNYKEVISERSSNYHYCKDLNGCLNNFELEQGVQEKKKQFIKEVKEAEKVMNEIRNRQF